MGRGGDKFLPFPTYYTNNPDHVLGARTSSRDRWLAAPKYKLLNLDDRDTAIKKYDKVGSLFKHLIPAVQKVDIAIHYQRIAECRGGGGVLAEKFGRVVRPASQNPYPIYDQNLRFSLPYL